MEKERFLFLLNNNSSLTEDETAEISRLQDEFPYSQAIHNLVARGAQLNNLNNKQTQLNVAAVYSTDRAVLKALVTALKEERKTEPPKAKPTPVIKQAEPPREMKVDANPLEEKPKPAEKIEVAPVATKEGKKVEQEAVHAPKLQPVNLSGDALINEVFTDIERLKKLKHNFELVADGFGLPEPIVSVVETKEEPVVEKKTESKKSKKEPTDGLIAEIKSTKKKIKPVDPRQKEQLDIIDNFIKSKPSITKKTKDSSSAGQTDLSEGSAVFSDNIISETLVEILIKQGKKEKAVEVLKKLIWKFPQKKAYFAAQIEELTK
ncbi:MAG: hypothetical protein R2820_04355 [Cyclobacteriaceae bacterium]|nr:hypothetical protein [Cyclobacteriaceae bacterium]